MGLRQPNGRLMRLCRGIDTAVTKLPNLGIGVRQGLPVTDEMEHFVRSPRCGQKLDMRDLAQVYHHNTPGQSACRLER